MTPAMSAAFVTGAGWDAVYVGTTIALIVGAVAVLWGAVTVRALGQQALDAVMKQPDFVRYAVRALILVMLLICLMS